MGIKEHRILKSDISIILEDKECKLIYEDTINYKSDLPLESAYLRLVACDKSKRTPCMTKYLKLMLNLKQLRKTSVFNFT